MSDEGPQWIVISLFLTVAGCGGDSGTNGNVRNGNGSVTVPYVRWQDQLNP